MTQPNLRTRRTVRDEQQQKRQLTATLAKNDTTLVAMTSEEFIDYAIAVKVSQGMTRAVAVDWLDKVLQSSTTLSDAAKREWMAFRDSFKNGGSFAPAIADAKKLTVLAMDLHRGGNVFSKYRISTYLGRPYVVIEGYPRLREHLTAARYLAKNPNVINMGIGKLGVKDAIKGGLVISVIFSVAFHALDQLMNDSATWHTFVAGVSLDVVSAVTGGTIAWGLVSFAMGGAAMVAVGPIAMVIILGIGATALLNALSNRFELNNKVAGYLLEAERRLSDSINEVKFEYTKALTKANEDPVGFMHRLFGVPYFGGLR